ncbi:phosphoadenosine phosphosulfate (PAPS) reductase family protein [Wolffia australiana]
MEIDKAISECSDRRLQTKYKNATFVIRRTFALYSFEEIAFSFNGGKDSTVLLHLLRAGYFLYNAEEGQRSSETSTKKECAMRTIYFDSPSAFPEINSFTYEIADTYGLELEVIHSDFKSGLEDVLKKKPIKAIFLGTRIGDPNAVGQEQFSPSSFGWPPFMRVNPILDWSYRDVWSFLLTCGVEYCSLYDKGYTSIGSIHDTVPNALLSFIDTDNGEHFKPAYLLSDGRLERAGRARKYSSSSSNVLPVSNGIRMDRCSSKTLSAAIIGVGDEILFGFCEDQIGLSLCKKLHAIGWQVTRQSVVRNDVDSVAKEVEEQISGNDMIFLFGGLGPLYSDVSVAGVAKAFGVRLAADEEFEEYLQHLIGDHSTGARNEMALLPEGITELLHNDMLPVPIIKCRNVIILSSTNISELKKEWECLLTLPTSPLVQITPFLSKHLSTTLSDVEVSQSILRLCHDFPDIYIGSHRRSRIGLLIISFVGKDQARIDLAAASLSKEFPASAFREFKCTDSDSGSVV